MTWHLHHSCEPIRTARKEIRPAFSSSFKIMLSFALFKTWHSPYMLSLMVVSRVTSCTLGPIKKILKNFLQLQWEFKNVCWTPPGVLDCFGWFWMALCFATSPALVYPLFFHTNLRTVLAVMSHASAFLRIYRHSQASTIFDTCHVHWTLATQATWQHLFIGLPVIIYCSSKCLLFLSFQDRVKYYCSLCVSTEVTRWQRRQKMLSHPSASNTSQRKKHSKTLGRFLGRKQTHSIMWFRKTIANRDSAKEWRTHDILVFLKPDNVIWSYVKKFHRFPNGLSLNTPSSIDHSISCPIISLIYSFSFPLITASILSG